MEAIRQIQARRLAIEWVIILERGKDPAKLELLDIRRILDELEYDNKNPEHWPQEECEEFLIEIIQNNGTTHPIHRPTTAV